MRAVALDREPLPQLSLGAWQLKERGIEVAAVQVWHEVRERALEVGRVAQELAERDAEIARLRRTRSGELAEPTSPRIGEGQA